LEDVEIIAVGQVPDCFEPDEVIDGRGQVALPAFFNAHCHAAMTLERGWAEDLPFDRWLNEKIWVAHTPKTYQKLAMKMPPLAPMLEHGARGALGTDGPASNSDLNMLEVARVTGLYQKEAQGDPEAMPRTLLLRLATQAPAAAMGFKESGTLRAGSAADLILLDTSSPPWIPRHDLSAAVVYAAHPGDVAYVWCNGKLPYRQGDFLTLDVDRIRWEAERRAFRMVGTPMRQVRAYRG
jgi:5-methylthioadenosine/S-adenosylhomocysteine deaminase